MTRDTHPPLCHYGLEKGFIQDTEQWRFQHTVLPQNYFTSKAEEVAEVTRSLLPIGKMLDAEHPDVSLI